MNVNKTNKSGVTAVNQEFSRYDQVNKPQSYQLSEGHKMEEFDEDYEIKACDISKYIEGSEADKEAFSQEFGEALEGIGFAILTGHGVDTNLYREAQESVRHLFENTTLEQRMKFKYQRFGSINEGYFPMKETTIIHPDLVEGWVFCRRAFNLNNEDKFDYDLFWPDKSYHDAFLPMVKAHEQLILPVMQSILRFLKCPEDHYNKKLTGTNFGFRLNYYPPISGADDELGAGRMLGHEDVDLFTLLPAQEVEGLQVLNRENNKWIRLNPEPGSIILNTGDYMQRITNDRLPSTTHRVSKPMTKDLYNKPRISLPMAIYVWEDEILEVLPGTGKPKYEPISAIKFHTNITSKYYGDDYATDVK